MGLESNSKIWEKCEELHAKGFVILYASADVDAIMKRAVKNVKQGRPPFTPAGKERVALRYSHLFG